MLELRTNSTSRAPRHVEPSVEWRWVGVWFAAIFYLFVTTVGWHRLLGFDSHAYWFAWHHSSMYGAAPGQQDAYLYSPAFAQLIWPLAQLPWSVFLWTWTAANLAVCVWLLMPLGWKWAPPLVAFCVPQAIVGNVWPLIALVTVLMFRRPTTSAFTLLTKPTCGIGLLWFVARGQLRPLLRAAAATASIAAVSVAISPGLWEGWVRLLVNGGTDEGRSSGVYEMPLSWRLPVAVVVVLYAARTERPWLLAVAVGLGAPVFGVTWVGAPAISMLVALPRLRRSTEPSASAEWTDVAAEHGPFTFRAALPALLGRSR